LVDAQCARSPGTGTNRLEHCERFSASPGRTLLTLLDAELAFGDLPLLDRAKLAVQEGDRIVLIGRNGTGKSSLLNVIAGRVTLDDGELQLRDGLRVAIVGQEPALPGARTLCESLLVRGRIEAIADERERWRAEARLAEFLHRFGLDGHTAPARASGGERQAGRAGACLATRPAAARRAGRSPRHRPYRATRIA
jgi:ATP-binding cassette subfamily F protein uup